MPYVPLNGINTVFDATLSNDIQDGLVEYFDWALLDKGNYFNVTKGLLAPNNLDYSQLRMSPDDNYASGQVWAGFRSNWVWQSGIVGINGNPNPIVGTDNAHPGISGVYVNGAFKPITSTGTYAHHVDYFNGQIIFNNPIPTGSIVQAEFSYKWINVHYANNVPWLKQLQTVTSEPTSSFFQTNGGAWELPPNARVQLPFIAIEVVPRRHFRGFQLGGGQWVYTDVLFHCFAETQDERNKLLDIVSFQNDRELYLFDTNKINASGTFPIDYRGVPVSGALRYPDLINQFNGGLLRLTRTTVQSQTVYGNVFGGVVRTTTEGVKNNI